MPVCGNTLLHPKSLLNLCLKNFRYYENYLNHQKIGGKNMKQTIKNFSRRAKLVLDNQRGDFYISDGVKVIIAVVLGALLLGAMTLIFNDTIIPKITAEINKLFG